MQRIKVSDNQRFLVHANGDPFFWLGDTAWELFHRLRLDEAERFLENRRQKGFTVIQAVALAEVDGLRVPNANGDLPFTDETYTTPNEAYFRHVDAVIDIAAEKGLYIGLLPTWGDKVTPLWGAGPLIFKDTLSAERYGEFIGSRYADRPNIIWINGGDRPPVHETGDWRPIWRALAEGVRRGAKGDVIMGFHPPGGKGSSEYLHDETWLSFNMWQSGHVYQDNPNWNMITSDYDRTPVKPVLDGEPCYEGHPIDPFLRQWKPEYGYFTDYDVRKQAYRAVFAGAFGHTYGHHSIWNFYQPGRQPINFPNSRWQEAVDHPGAFHMTYLRRLMESRPFLSRIPDQSLILNQPQRNDQHMRATRCASGSYAMIYIPNGSQTVEVDMSKLSGPVQAWWYDPRSGESFTIGRYTNSGTQTFTTSPHGPDWVLVLDDHTQIFGAPGVR